MEGLEFFMFDMAIRLVQTVDRDTNKLARSIGHFRVPKTLTFKMRLGAQRSFICIRVKNDFHIKGSAPNLVLKQRPGGTRKWPVARAVSRIMQETRFQEVHQRPSFHLYVGIYALSSGRSNICLAIFIEIFFTSLEGVRERREFRKVKCASTTLK